MALVFDGGDYSDMGNYATHRPASAISFGWWMKNRVNPSGAQKGLISKTYYLQNGFGAYCGSGVPPNNNDIVAGVVIAGVFYGGLSASLLTAGTWYHFFYTYTGAAYTLYVNGAVDYGPVAQAGAIDWSGTINNLFLGTFYDGTGGKYDGTLEDVRIYDRGLSAAEVKTIYTARGHDDIRYGLIGKWCLNEEKPGAGPASLRDYSKYNYWGSLTGGSVCAESVLSKHRVAVR